MDSLLSYFLELVHVPLQHMHHIPTISNMATRIKMDSVTGAMVEDIRVSIKSSTKSWCSSAGIVVFVLFSILASGTYPTRLLVTNSVSSSSSSGVSTSVSIYSTSSSKHPHSPEQFGSLPTSTFSSSFSLSTQPHSSAQLSLSVVSASMPHSPSCVSSLSSSSSSSC